MIISPSKDCSVTDLDPDDPSLVVALRFDESAVAQELADWCGGSVVQDDPLDPTSPVIAVRVPTRQGSALAERGDWVVRTPDGDYTTMRHSEFVARHEPLQ